MTKAEPQVIELAAPVLGEAEKRALAEVIDDRWLTMGDRVRRFEQAFAELHGVDEAVAVSSGTAALQLCLAAFDVGPGAEVLVPSMSFVATASVVVHAGATPVFVDVEGPDRPHMSIEDARRRITGRTRAIMIMHYGGYEMDVAAWRALAGEHGLLLFEDAAHAAGLAGPGATSDAAAFSFFTNKNMTTAEGGMVVIGDPERRQRARLLRSHGMTANTLDRTRGRAVGYDVVACGHNFRMDELRGALGLVQVERLPGWNRTRRELADRYRAELGREVPEVVVPFAPGHRTAAHIMPVLLPDGCDRPRVMAEMRAAGVQTSVHFPAIHQFEYYRRAHGAVSLPNTERFSARQLTLPLHPALEPGDVERVVSALREAIRAAR
ncbi:MAG TPA: DegT/DnrJ/EryC1/StrS family aminotransferase [Pseudonocardia sp.]|uniref:DegT/DnrJ/EryC1/StrS family aminotransferase n=1 Tax=Pseudonocardia sp. TaxID=60912 RepID=UPI002B4AF139|nr:DegT/DnrJ/EryC1/StrS family aminotransferase [Pseudonocardia sp.]HLU59336.1 DegT/DnrJ/EryC1/StrS family aminotransferase [Pseudonocardia sp.]